MDCIIPRLDHNFDKWLGWTKLIFLRARVFLMTARWLRLLIVDGLVVDVVVLLVASEC